MKWLGTKRIAIKSIVLPGNFSATKAAPRITDLATSIREHGTIEPPVVEAKTNRLVVGHDRIAALLSLKEKQIEVRMVEGSATELRRMQIAENLHRRQDDRTSLIAEYARSEESEIAQLTQSAAETPVRTAQRVKQEAHEVVAKAAGISVAGVKKAKQRAKKRAQAAAPQPELTEEMAGGKIDLPPGFKAFELEVSLASRSVIDETAKWLGEWDKSLRDLLRQLTEMEKRGNYAVAGAHLQRIREQLQNAGHTVRDAIPASLCFYCKAQPSSTPNCPACGGTGVVGRHGGDNVPPELKLGGDKARVAVDGKFVLVGAGEMVPVKNVLGGEVMVSKKFAEAAKGAVAKRRGVRVVAVDESGAETDVPLPEDDGEELAF